MLRKEASMDFRNAGFATWGRPFGLSLVLLLGGCAHGVLSPSGGAPAVRTSGKVASVTVSVDPSLVAERRAVYDQFQGDDLIAREIVAALERNGRYDPAGDTRVDVTVTDFRLRSAGNVVWNGLFAGVDRLEGHIEIQQEPTEPALYSFVLSGSEDVYLKFAAGARFRSLARVLAAKVSGVFNDAGT
jgi:hypothetical protein